MSILPKGPWRAIIVTWIVFTPYYVWLGLSAIYDSLPSPRWIGLVFGTYLVAGYFAVKAILKMLRHKDEDRERQSRDS